MGNRFLVLNVRLFGIIAIAAIIGLSLTACGGLDTTDDVNKQTVITVTGIPSEYTGKYGYVGIGEPGNVNKDRDVGVSQPKLISGDSVRCEVFRGDKLQMVSVDGSYAVVFIIIENSNSSSQQLFSGTTLKGLTTGNTNIVFTDFTQ